MSAPARTPSRIRLRRRLLLWSAPVAAVALIAAAGLVAVVMAGDSAVRHHAERDIDGLATDVSVLRFADIAGSAQEPWAAGALAVLDGRLADADAEFDEARRRAEPGQLCPILVNLELVRETQGDLATGDGRSGPARERYTSALGVIDSAPAGCFAGNDDPDPERRAVRHDAAARVTAKLDFVNSVPPPPPAAPPNAPPPPPPPPAAGGAPTSTPQPDEPRRLDPRGGDPLERLQQVLRDAAGR